MSANSQTIETAQKFVNLVSSMGDILDEIMLDITDHHYLRLMNNLKAIYDEHLDNPIVVQAIRQARMVVRKAPLNTEGKINSDRYASCLNCNRLVVKEGMDDHKKTRVCLNVLTTKNTTHVLKTKHTDKYKFAIIFDELLINRQRRCDRNVGTEFIDKMNLYLDGQYENNTAIDRKTYEDSIIKEKVVDTHECYIEEVGGNVRIEKIQYQITGSTFNKIMYPEELGESIYNENVFRVQHLINGIESATLFNNEKPWNTILLSEGDDDISILEFLEAEKDDYDTWFI